MHRLRLLPVALLLGAVLAVHCNTDADPMLAAESGNYPTGVRYTNEPMIIPRSYFEMMKRSASAPSLATSSAKISPRAASSAFFSKPSLDSAESGEIYKKAASEYWGHSGEQDESLEDQSSYGYGPRLQQSQGYSMPHGMSGYMKGKEISITPDHKPITLHYRTHSQPIMVHQTRIPGPKPEVKYTKSHEEPHKVVHEVVRPIIQEVREIIQPYRRVTQEIRPVLEEVKTVVAKSAGGGGAGHGGQGMGQQGGYGKQGLAYAESKQQPQLYRKTVQYEPSPSESHISMALPSGVVIRRSKVFLKNGIPVYASQYMGPALESRS